MTEVSTQGAARLRRLTDISRAFTGVLAADSVLDLAADCAMHVLGAERSALMLLEEDGRLRIAAARGVSADAMEGFHEPLDERLLFAIEKIFGAGASDRFLGVPVVLEGRVTGILAVDGGTHQALDENAEWLLSALADQTAVALEGARLARARADLEERVEVMERYRAETERALKIASHDLRTPLSAIQGYLELLATGVYGPLTERQNDVIARVRQVGWHLQAVLEIVLEMARLTSGARPLEEVAFPVIRVIEEAAEIVRPAAGQKGVDVRLELSVATVRADRARLRQVLLHLLDNAVKYSPAGTRVTVTSQEVRADGQGVCEVFVQDQGPGIPPKLRDQIFEAGYRIAAPGQDPGGSGLGLSIARGLVESMGGALDLLAADGAGARFRIRLPVPVPESGSE